MNLIIFVQGKWLLWYLPCSAAAFETVVAFVNNRVHAITEEYEERRGALMDRSYQLLKDCIAPEPLNGKRT